MAKITASFDRVATRDGYYLKVSIDPYPDTDPVSLESCLLVNTRGAGELVRCATLLDYEKYTSVNPPILYLTCMGRFNGLAVGDIVRFMTIPAAWELASITAPFDVPIDSIEYAVSYGCVRVDPTLSGLTELPSGFDGDQTIVVLRDGTPFLTEEIIPVICGSHPNELPFEESAEGISQIYSFRSVSTTVFPTVETAMNMYESVRAQIQALVDEANTSGTNFPYSETEVFE